MAIVEITAEMFADHDEVVRRIFNESSRLHQETGLGMPLQIGGVEQALLDGDRIFLARSGGDEPHRVLLWMRRVPGQGVWIRHAWGPSTRHLKLVRFMAQRIADRLGGNTMGHYPNTHMPLIVAANAILLPQTGRYVGNTWVNEINGPVCRIRISTALQRLQAAGIEEDV